MALVNLEMLNKRSKSVLNQFKIVLKLFDPITI